MIQSKRQNALYLLLTLITLLSTTSCGHHHHDGDNHPHSFIQKLKEIKPIEWFKHAILHKHKKEIASADDIAVLEKTQSIKTYDDYQKQSRALIQSLFDSIPSNSEANSEYIFKTIPLNLDIAKIKAPTADEVQKYTKQYSLIRPVPFPFYSIFSIPSDACGSNMADIYYSQALFQRQYGLDLTSSFFPVSDYPLFDPNLVFIKPTFISNLAVRPLSHPVPIGATTIDNMPAFLTYYYRGWFDHIHGWSTEGSSFYSLFEPVKVVASNIGTKKELKLNRPIITPMDGFELEFHLNGNIKSILLSLQDMQDQYHTIAIGTKLNLNQQGWEFNLPANNTKEVVLYLPLSAEKNKNAFNLLGKSFIDPAYLKKARVVVYGDANSSIELNMFRQVPFDRITLTKQIALMRTYNIYPNTTTYHGGSSSWYQEIASSPANDPFTIDLDNQKITIIRKPMGSVANSPTYLTDLFNQYGIIYRNMTYGPLKWKPETTIVTKKFTDDMPYYYSERKSFTHTKYNPRPAHSENLGQSIDEYLNYNDFGFNRILYTHFNYYNKDAFAETPKNSSDAISMSELRKLPPTTEKALSILANLKYNLTGAVHPYQRVWVPSVSANMRYATTLNQLMNNTSINNNTINITSWIDPVSKQRTPEPNNITLDLHGQTFYVPKALSASVKLDGKPLSALKRNPKDFTGRESVTVVDLTHPKLFFDKLDPIENHYARIAPNAASLFYQAQGSTPGKYTLQVVSDKPGLTSVAIKPYLFDNYETDFFRFVIKKSKPDLQIFVGWKGNNDHLFVATDGIVPGNPSTWRLPSYADTQFHDYVVDYSDLNYAKDAPLARGPVGEIQLGMLNAKAGDSITIDRLEFLAAPGVKAEENGFVLGGRIFPATDHIPVTLVYGDHKLQTWTERGGWYFFNKIPKDTIAEITAEYKGVPFTPARGRLIQVHRNDVEYHINIADLRTNSVPRPNLTNMKILPSMQKSTSAAADAKFDAERAPHTEWAYTGNPMGADLSYFGADYTNNFGYRDKDRRQTNVDNAYRILLLGYCLEEALQTPQFQHVNLLLESMLRQKLGRNVEVIVAATSSSSISSRWDSIEKYGQLFKPDLVILVNNPSSALTMEPTLQERYIGFQHEHPPYVLFDFDANGKLFKINKDSMYGMHVVKPSSEGITPQVPSTQAYVTPEMVFPLTERSHQLLAAVISQKYLPLIKSWGGQVVLIHSYYPLDFPKKDGKHDSNYTLNAVFPERMQEVCEKTGIICLNLYNSTYRSDYKEVATWEHECHLTPTGHYLLARAFMDAILPIIKK